MDRKRLSARHLPPEGGQALRVFGDLVTIKAVAADTGGAYALFEARTEPGRGMPPHLQRYEDETILGLEGTYAVRIGDETIALGPGGYAFVPRGTPHAYTNVGGVPARLLVLVSPGGVHELFLADVGAPAATVEATTGPDGSADPAWIALAAEKYGVAFCPPPNGRARSRGPPRRRGRRAGAPKGGNWSMAGWPGSMPPRIATDDKEDPMTARTLAPPTPCGAQLAFARVGTALAAVAVGALAVGSLAVGRLAIRRIGVQDGRIERLAIDDLSVGRLVVRDLVVERDARAGDRPTPTRRLGDKPGPSAT